MSASKAIGIVGASGYTGGELLRLCATHPEFSVCCVSADSNAGEQVSSIHPSLAERFSGLQFQDHDAIRSDMSGCDLVFVALPHGRSMEFIAKGVSCDKIVDLGGDFRLLNPSAYNEWYGFPHVAPEMLSKWCYGLTELFREQIRMSTRVANPGCYPTAVCLAVAPLLRAQLIERQIVAPCISGTSGAGKALRPDLHFSSFDENFFAYRFGTHQHTPEIEQVLSSVAEERVEVLFLPHLAPFTRGIHASVVCRPKEGIAGDTFAECLREAYRDDAFVTIEPKYPDVKSVRGSNRVRISCHYDARTRHVIVTSVLDNLVKGAAGQAIQNANILFDLEETCGLPTEAVFP